MPGINNELADKFTELRYACINRTCELAEDEKSETAMRIYVIKNLTRKQIYPFPISLIGVVKK